MNRIRLNDGTEYEAELCAAADGVLSLRTHAAFTVADICAVFAVPEKTCRIVCTPDYGEEIEYAGYTGLTGILRDRWNGKILVQLEKEAPDAV